VFAGVVLAPAVALVTKTDYRPLAVLLAGLAAALGLAAFVAGWGNSVCRKPIAIALSKFLLNLLMLGLVAGAVSFFLLKGLHAERPGAVAAQPDVEGVPAQPQGGPPRSPDAPVEGMVGESGTGPSLPLPTASGNGPSGSR
jgi:hypothetical protein